MCTRSFVLRVTYLLATVSASVAVVSGFGQALSFTVDDPRPLAAAILNIEARFGWVITYEDPRYLHAGDSKDVTLAVRRTYQQGQDRILVPRGGPFTFVAPAADNSKVEAEPAMLNALVAQYNASGYPGKFSVRRAGSVFHVVPTMLKNANGALEPYTPGLDTRVFQTAGDRTALAAVESLVEQTNGRLVVGRVPTNLLRQVSVSQPAANDTARNLLLAILKASEKPLSWQVLCDPGATSPCVLNIHIVGTVREK